MKKPHSLFLISLSVLNLMALTTPVHAGDGLTFDTGFDTGFDTSYDTGFDTGFENTTTGKSESASGSSAGGSILAVGLGALLLSQVGKKGKSSGDAAKNAAATNSGALNPTPSPAPTHSPTPSPSPTPEPSPTPISLGAPTALTPELPAGMQAIPVLLAVGGMALYQRKKKSA